jgi:hypothetical protein
MKAEVVVKILRVGGLHMCVCVFCKSEVLEVLVSRDVGVARKWAMGSASGCLKRLKSRYVNCHAYRQLLSTCSEGMSGLRRTTRWKIAKKLIRSCGEGLDFYTCASTRWERLERTYDGSSKFVSSSFPIVHPSPEYSTI